MAKTGVKAYSNVFDCFSTTMREEGVRGIYSGLSAGLMRQGTYSTMRLGFYQNFRRWYKEAGYTQNFASMYTFKKAKFKKIKHRVEQIRMYLFNFITFCSYYHFFEIKF